MKKSYSNGLILQTSDTSAQPTSTINRKVSSRIKKFIYRAKELYDQKHYDKALDVISAAMDTGDWENPESLYLAGAILRQLGHAAMSAHMFRRAVALAPDNANIWLNFGASLHEISCYHEAIEAFKVSHKLEPRMPSTLQNLAASCVQLGRYADGLNYANMALEMNPDYPLAKGTKAMACLGLERWREGFSLYKNLYGVTVIRRIYRQPKEPEWNGEKGLSVVVQSDQGVGDAIMYASMLSEMEKDCGHIILDTDPKLVNLFARNFPNIEVHGTKHKTEGVDWVNTAKVDASIHISGIGRFYRTRDKDFPRKPFLTASPALVDKWMEKLRDCPKPWVGLTWTGGTIRNHMETRSVELQDWEPVIQAGGTFVDLSYHNSLPEVEKYNNTHASNVEHFDVNQQDYEDTLALIACMDLVITVQTTVAHACGSIGKKAFVLVNNIPQWRYGTSRDNVIWYPKDSLKLFRQGRDEESLSDAIQRIMFAYTDFLKRKESP